jgi:hypothetical protein
MTTALCKGRAFGGWMAQAARQTSVRRVRLGIVTFKFLRAYDDKGTQQSYAPGE